MQTLITKVNKTTTGEHSELHLTEKRTEALL